MFKEYEIVTSSSMPVLVFKSLPTPPVVVPTPSTVCSV